MLPVAHSYRTVARRQSPASGQRREKRGGGGVVAEGLADVGVAVNVAGTEDEASAELEGILANPVLAVACGPRPFPGRRVVAAEKMEQGSGSEAHGTIGLPSLVD